VSPELDAAEIEALRAQLDEAAIRRLINGYFFGLDRRDADAFRAVFTPGTVERRDGQKVDTEAYIAGLLRVGRFAYSHHVTASVGIELEGDRASGDAYAVAFLVVAPADDDRGDGRLVVRGLRYLDGYVRLESGWRIARRDGPIPLWQYECDSVPPALPDFVLAD
jgi:SnoaL-like domain